MTRSLRLAILAGLTTGLSFVSVPPAVGQDGTAAPSPSPAALASPGVVASPGASPAATPCPSVPALPSPAASPVALATPSASPALLGASPETAASPSASPMAGESPAAIDASPSPAVAVSCPAGTTSPVTIPAGASVTEILGLGIGGSDLTVQSGGLQFLDSDARYYRPLTRALRRQDKTLEDWTTHVGFDEDAGILVTAFEIDGADASAFLEAGIELMLSGMPSRRHERETGEVGGKPVTIIRPARAEGRVFHFYPSGDVVWVVMAPDAFVAEFLGALP